MQTKTLDLLIHFQKKKRGLEAMNCSFGPTYNETAALAYQNERTAGVWFPTKIKKMVMGYLDVPQWQREYVKHTAGKIRLKRRSFTLSQFALYFFLICCVMGPLCSWISTSTGIWIVRKSCLAIELFSSGTDINADLIHLKHKDLNGRRSFFWHRGLQQKFCSRRFHQPILHISIKNRNI